MLSVVFQRHRNCWHKKRCGRTWRYQFMSFYFYIELGVMQWRGSYRTDMKLTGIQFSGTDIDMIRSRENKCSFPNKCIKDKHYCSCHLGRQCNIGCVSKTITLERHSNLVTKVYGCDCKLIWRVCKTATAVFQLFNKNTHVITYSVSCFAIKYMYPKHVFLRSFFYLPKLTICVQTKQYSNKKNKENLNTNDTKEQKSCNKSLSSVTSLKVQSLREFNKAAILLKTDIVKWYKVYSGITTQNILPKRAFYRSPIQI